MRQVKPGSIQAAVQASIKAAGGLEAAGNDLGMSASNLSRASSNDEDRPGGLGVNHLHRLGRITPGAAEPIAAHFAGLADGVFQPVAQPGVTNLFQQASKTIIECGEAQAAMVRAAEHACAGNCDAADREIDDAVRHLLAFKAAMRAKPKAEGRV
ncbi:hypothetical protein [Leisingera sp. JC11]|uniref:hypothetical protein n=1 Tax=Leisingera sp. JC11 TaxID=3042469 RepID=UPI00345656D0